MPDILRKRADIPVEVGRLEGSFAVPPDPGGVVLFVQSSSRLSAGSDYVASVLHERSIATLLFDLLTPVEDSQYRSRFDIGLLTARLLLATEWVRAQQEVSGLELGYFGAGTGAAAALCAGAQLGREVRAVVSRGGRPDLAGQAALNAVTAPTLLLVGGRDTPVIALNREALRTLRCEKQLRVITGAGAQFDEPGTLEQVAQLAADWLGRHLSAAQPEAT
ncbi:MAG TPA: alpha/beta hydrolase [Burkholderiales bacterium]|nr:alpha/beta hydrolase [Burkholderiales bacterium]